MKPASAKHSGFVRWPSASAVVMGMGLMACAPQPGPAAHLTIADIQPIVAPLTYRELLGAKCGEPNIAVKTAFLADLQASGASVALVSETEEAAAKIEAEERDTPNEYVCTVELFESTEKNASAAQKAWAELKSRKS